MGDSLDDSTVDLSIIVVAWNVKELVDECFRALRASSDTLKKEVLFVDNASTDGTADYVEKRFPEVILIRSDRNLGFIRANNLAFRRARGRYVLMLNSDAFVGENTLQETVDFMRSHPEAGVVGARLVGRDGVPQPSVRFFPTPFKLFLNSVGLNGRLPGIGPLDDIGWDHKNVRESDWVVGCFLLTRKDLIERMGFFLREDFFMYNDDNDLCLRIKKMGYKVFFYPTIVIHLGGATAMKMGKTTAQGIQIEKLQIESQAIYYRKNYSPAMVVWNLFLMLLSNFLKAVKRLFVHRDGDGVEEMFGRMKLIVSIYLRTGFGRKAIH